MNVELLREIQDKLRTIPEKEFDMTDWTIDLFNRGEPCGTSHCIGGWACALKGQKLYSSYWAAELLGLDTYQATRLFFADHWPRGFGRWGATREQAIARIDLFIETNGEK